MVQYAPVDPILRVPRDLLPFPLEVVSPRERGDDTERSKGFPNGKRIGGVVDSRRFGGRNEGIVDVAAIVIYRPAAGKTARNRNAVLARIGKRDLGIGVLIFQISMLVTLLIMDIVILKTRYQITIDYICDYEEAYNILGKV